MRTPIFARRGLDRRARVLVETWVGTGVGGKRMILICQEDPFRGAGQIVVLPGLKRPEKCGQADRSHEQGNWYEPDQDAHGAVSRTL